MRRALLFLGMVAMSSSAHSDEYAPLTRGEFVAFFDNYQSVSDCLNAYKKESGVTPDEILSGIATAGKIDEFNIQATALLKDEYPEVQEVWSANVSAIERAGLLLVGLGSYSGNENLARSRRMAALAMGVLYQTYATGGRCTAGNSFGNFIEKAIK
jgi:hypothetical protein